MSSDASTSTTSTSEPEKQIDTNLQVRFKTEEGKLLLLLPPESNNGEIENPTPMTWTEIWQQLKQRLIAGEKFWQPKTEVELIAFDRLLDTRQLQEIAEALQEEKLQLEKVHTSRRQTAVAAATVGYSVEQKSISTSLNQNSPEKVQPLAEPLYLEMTVRSGVEIRHPGTVIVVGDLNPGGSVIADGDILVWGRLRGVVHAGARGNSKSVIMTLQMEPALIRIAEQVARGPEKPPVQFYPEVAYVVDQSIRISRARDFARM
ncbi:septum site-determining protein MinC [Okeania sp.]|uniref:septum site-determining protein MinC n=1 Tax=Okeania sp. TaxID=3100323 RepID=UPI002B4AE557|nr:septum site-determining protein MinC [Okeania sp.]MEB3341948.1 septum site-determining protein MinC [Okeania sp.]